MHQSFYQKYRPQNFSDVIGQENIVKALIGSIKQDRIGHAYLLTGPRGTGKTTLARIYSKALNCSNRKGADPCGKCESCIAIAEGSSVNIIEIDAASHTGVDNIRQLREEAQLLPTNAPYKVYIIDEVHMLSTGAFNALLKILEEPPSHVVFILATTEVHKVPETILSRTQRYDLRRLTLEHILQKLTLIAKQEGVSVDTQALELIAVAAEGGMRNAESLLSQVFSLGEKKITLHEAQQILGSSHKDSVSGFVDHILEKDAPAAFQVIDDMIQSGVLMEHFLKDVLQHLRQLLFISVESKLVEQLSTQLTREQISSLKKQAEQTSLSWLVFSIDTFLAARESLRSAFIPQLPLETAIVKIIYRNNEPTKPSSGGNKPPKNPSTPIKKNEPQKGTIRKIASEPNDQRPTHETPQSKSSSTSSPTTPVEVKYALDDIHTAWPTLLQDIHEHHHALSALLSNCSPTRINNGVVIVVTKFSLYKDKLSETATKLTIEKVLGTIVKAPVSLNFLTEDEAGEKIEPNWSSSRTHTSILSDAAEVFGSKPASSEA